MSTILKALKRLDEQRRAETAPQTLQEQVLSRGSALRAAAGRGRREAVLVGAGVLAVVAIAGVARLALSPEPEPDTANPAALATAPAASAAPHAATVPVLATSGVERPTPSPASGAAVVPELPERTQAEVATSAVPPRASRSPAEDATSDVPPAAAPEVSRRSAAPPPASEDAPRAASPPPIQREAPEPLPPSVPQPAVAEAAPAPAPIAESPEPTGTAPSQPEPEFPRVVVERTQWHPSAERRSAAVRVGDAESRELREGDAWGGVVVKEIRPSSVTFVYGSDEFEREVGGS